MPTEGLVAIQKEVSRGGKTFSQRYWTKPEDIAKSISEKGYAQTIKDIGGDINLVSNISGSWSGSSTSSSGLKAQAVAARMMERSLDNINLVKHPSYKNTFEEMYNKSDKEIEVGVKTLTAMHACSQAALKDHPPTLKLYRGIDGGFADSIKSDFKTVADAGVPYEKAQIGVALNPMNSFSESPKTARKFGPVIIRMDTPKEAIVMTHLNTPGLQGMHKHETEHVVAVPGPALVKARDIVGPGGETIKKYFDDYAAKQAGKTPEPAKKVEPYDVNHVWGTENDKAGSSEKAPKLSENEAKKAKVLQTLKDLGGSSKAESHYEAKKAEFVEQTLKEMDGGAKSESPTNKPPYREAWHKWAVKELGYHGGTKKLPPEVKDVFEKTAASAKDYLKNQDKVTKSGLKAYIKSAAKMHAETAGVKLPEKQASAIAKVAHAQVTVEHAVAAPAEKPRLHLAKVDPEVAAFFKATEGKSPPYRAKWDKWTQSTLNKAGIPKEQHAEAKEKISTEAKVFLAQHVLKKEKVPKPALKSFIKGLATKYKK